MPRKPKLTGTALGNDALTGPALVPVKARARPLAAQPGPDDGPAVRREGDTTLVVGRP